MQVYNDELYHYGKIGMKWHNRKVRIRKEDNNILNARNNLDNKKLEQKKAWENVIERGMYDHDANANYNRVSNELYNMRQMSVKQTSKEKRDKAIGTVVGIMTIIGSATVAGLYEGSK